MLYNTSSVSYQQFLKKNKKKTSTPSRNALPSGNVVSNAKIETPKVLLTGVQDWAVTQLLSHKEKDASIDEIRNMVDSNPNTITHQDFAGRTALIEACVRSHTQAATFLVDRGSDVNAVDDYHNTPLHWAARKGNIEIAQLLLNKGAKLEARTKGQQTPLHLACEEGKAEIARLLIQQGADFNSVQDRGDTCLHVAVIWESTSVVKLLLESGSNRLIKNENGQFALDIANKQFGNIMPAYEHSMIRVIKEFLAKK